MALNGSLQSNKYNASGYGVNQAVGIRLDWSATQNTAGNYSTISWALVGETANGYTGWFKSGGFRVIIDGETVYSKPTDYRIQLGNGTIVATGTKIIYHNADGSRSFNAYIEAGVYTYAVSVSGSATFTLDTIPRASTFTATNANVGSKSTVTITKASSAFVHRVWYRTSGINNGVWVEPELNKVIEGTSYSFTIPTSFYNAMSTVKTKSVEVYLATYTSKANATASTYGNQAGHKIVNITVTVPQSASLPESAVNFTAVNTVSSRANQVLSGIDNVATTVGVTAKNSATVNSIVVSNGSNSSSSNYSTATANKSYTFNKCVNGSFKVVVTDSRGYQVTKTVNLTLVEYFKPTIAIKNYEVNTDGVLTFKLAGTGFTGNIGSSKNVFTLWYRVRNSNNIILSGSGSGWKEVPSSSISWSGNSYSTNTFSINTGNYLSTYKIQGCIRDSIYKDDNNIYTNEISVNCLPVFDWGEDDFNFNVPVFGEEFISANNKGFWGTDKSGVHKKIIEVSSANNVVINPKEGGSGSTTLLGGPNQAVNIGWSGEPVALNHNGYKMSYDKGDTITLHQNTDCFAGLVTTSTTELFFTIPINRPICAASVSVSGNIQGRGVNGYINGTDYDNSYFNINTTSGHHTTTYEIKPTGISVKIAFNAVIANATNNTPVTMTPRGSLTVTFN